MVKFWVSPLLALIVALVEPTRKPESEETEQPEEPETTEETGSPNDSTTEQLNLFEGE